MTERDVHWAGVADLRLNAAALVSGFAELSVRAEGTNALSWSSLFHRDRPQSFLPGTAVELMLPQQLVGRAMVEKSAERTCSLSGVVPWDGWTSLVAPVEERVQVFERAQFLEVVAAATISPSNWVPIGDLPLSPGARLLLDYRQVTQVLVPLSWFLTAAEELDAKRLKVAVVAHRPLAFGISRQTILTLNLDEERSFGVFTALDQAKDWLLR